MQLNASRQIRGVRSVPLSTASSFTLLAVIAWVLLAWFDSVIDGTGKRSTVAMVSRLPSAFSGALTVVGSRCPALPIVAATSSAASCQDEANDNGHRITGTVTGSATGGAVEPMPALPGWLVEHSIYIPYEKLRDTFEQQQRGVFVPYEEFDRLWELARRSLKPEIVELPPHSGIIVESSNRAEATRDRLVVTSQLELEFLRTGWHEVPLSLADAALRRADLDGEPARLVRGADGQNALLVHIDQVPLRKRLEIEYAKAVSSTGGQYHVSLAVPTSAMNRWEVSVDERDVDVSLTPAAVVTRRETNGNDQNQTSTVTAIVGSVANITLRWTPRAVGAERLSAIVTAESATRINVQKSVVRLQQRLALNIQRASVGRLGLRVPSGFEVVGVTADFVKRWEKDPHDEQLLAVEFFEEMRGHQALDVDLEMPLDDGESQELSLACVEVVEATRQPGTVDVSADMGIGLDVVSLMGLVRTRAATGEDGGRQLSFRHAAVPYVLRIMASELKPSVRGIQSIESVLQPRLLTSHVTFLLDIKQAGLFSIPLDVPEGVELIQVVGLQCRDYQAVVVDQVSPPREDSTARTVHLSQQALGKVALSVLVRQPVSLEPIQAEHTAAQLVARWPRLADGFAEYLTGQLRIALPESLLVTPSDQPLLRPIDFGQFVSYTNAAGGVTALHYEFVQNAPPLSMALAMRRPQVMVDWISQWSIEPGLIRQVGEMIYDVKFSPIQSIRIDMPKSISGRVRLETPGWRTTKQEPQPDDVPADHEAWLLQGSRDLYGRQQLRFTWEEPLEDVPIGDSVPIRITGIKPRGVDRSRGQIVVKRSELFDLQVADGAKGLRPIDATRDLLNGQEVDDAVIALEYAGDWELSLKAARLELYDLKRTSIPRALVRAVWLRQGSLSVQAVYQVHGVRQRLRIKMPPGFDAETGFDQNPVRVDGQIVPVERGAGDEMVISLGTRERNKTLIVELRYTMPIHGNQLMVPTFPEDCAVQKTVLCVYVPPEWAPLAAQGPWTDSYGEQVPELASRVFRLRNQSDHHLLKWIATDSVTPEELGKFETDGRLYLFSTLQPQPGPQGALQLPMVRRDVLNVGVFALLALGGLLLLRAPWRVRLATAMFVVAAIIVLIMAVPMATEPLSLQMLALTAGFVGVVWVLGSVMATSRKLWGHSQRSEPANDGKTEREQEGSPSPAGAAPTGGDVPADESVNGPESSE